MEDVPVGEVVAAVVVYVRDLDVDIWEPCQPQDLPVRREVGSLRGVGIGEMVQNDRDRRVILGDDRNLSRVFSKHLKLDDRTYVVD